MEYEVGKAFEQIQAEQREQTTMLAILLRLFEKSEPQKYKQVVEELRKEAKQ